MWPFKKKQIIDENKIVLPTAEEILNGANPWFIRRTEIGSTKQYVFEIFVFRYDGSFWSNLSNCSDSVIGVEQKEFIRMTREHFNASYDQYRFNGVYFKDKKDAEKALEEFCSYYENFHLPRALMKRMACYCEGGYQPYFKDKFDKMNFKKEIVKEKVIKLKRKKA